MKVKNFPLGIPLTVSGIATVATMFTNKRLHVACGAHPFHPARRPASQKNARRSHALPAGSPADS